MMMMEVVVRSNPFDISPCTIPSPAHFRAPWIQRPCACAARFAASGQVALWETTTTMMMMMMTGQVRTGQAGHALQGTTTTSLSLGVLALLFPAQDWMNHIMSTSVQL
jgi:hypothetical protein